jgi:hypothetical protein
MRMQTTSLRETGTGRPASSFYRASWCPFCNVTLRAYEQQLVTPLTARGITLIAIPPMER